MKNIKILSLISLALSCNVFSNAYAKNHIYIGGDIGVAMPLISEFTYKDEKSGNSMKASLSNSFFYNGKIGYSFYPQMSAEIAVSYHPTHVLSYNFPDMPGYSGKTNVSSISIMANIVYDLAKLKSNIVPFVFIGAGVSSVTVEASNVDISPNIKLFSNEKTTGNYLTWNLGLGLAKEITDNFSMNVTGRVHIIHNVKINYSSANDVAQLTKRDPIEKIIGFGEISLGFKYKLPF